MAASDGSGRLGRESRLQGAQRFSRYTWVRDGHRRDHSRATPRRGARRAPRPRARRAGPRPAHPPGPPAGDHAGGRRRAGGRAHLRQRVGSRGHDRAPGRPPRSRRRLHERSLRGDPPVGRHAGVRAGARDHGGVRRSAVPDLPGLRGGRPAHARPPVRAGRQAAPGLPEHLDHRPRLGHGRPHGRRGGAAEPPLAVHRALLRQPGPGEQRLRQRRLPAPDRHRGGRPERRSRAGRPRRLGGGRSAPAGRGAGHPARDRRHAELPPRPSRQRPDGLRSLQLSPDRFTAAIDRLLRA